MGQKTGSGRDLEAFFKRLNVKPYNPEQPLLLTSQYIQIAVLVDPSKNEGKELKAKWRVMPVDTQLCKYIAGSQTLHPDFRVCYFQELITQAVLS